MLKNSVVFFLLSQKNPKNQQSTIQIVEKIRFTDPTHIVLQKFKIKS